MATFSIDPNNRIIVLDQVAPVGGIVQVDVKTNLYSEMKVYWKDQSSVSGLIFPWVAVGGYSYGGGRYQGTDYFLRNDLGWRIRPYEADHELQIIGNLRPYNSAFETFLPTVGNFTVYAPQERSGVFQIQQDTTSYDEFNTKLDEMQGLVGKNTRWSNITSDANKNVTAATITKYTDNTFTVVEKVWQWTATYNGDSVLTSYQMQEV